MSDKLATLGLLKRTWPSFHFVSFIPGGVTYSCCITSLKNDVSLLLREFFPSRWRVLTRERVKPRLLWIRASYRPRLACRWSLWQNASGRKGLHSNKARGNRMRLIRFSGSLYYTASRANELPTNLQQNWYRRKASRGVTLIRILFDWSLTSI